jgi:hypothetical protein
LQPVTEAFLEGAYFVYGHTMMQRSLGAGYQSEWAKKHLPERRERNAFYTQVGRKITPGAASRQRLQAMQFPLHPAEILSGLL